MQSDEDFNVKFVNIIRLHRCLYDKKVPEYRNKDEQEKAWQQISAETRENVSHCKERWRNLRACLSRYMKQQNSADPQHKPYYLTEHMQFLFPFLKLHRQVSRNSNLNKISYHSEASLDIKTSEGDETNDLNYISNTHHQSETETIPSVNDMSNVQPSEVDQTEVDHEVLFSTSTERIQRDAKRIKLDHQQNATSTFLHSENTDMDFFRSILPDIQCMSSLQKRKFKIGILELIDHVLLKYPDKQ